MLGTSRLALRQMRLLSYRSIRLGGIQALREPKKKTIHGPDCNFQNNKVKSCKYVCQCFTGDLDGYWGLYPITTTQILSVLLSLYPRQQVY